MKTQVNLTKMVVILFVYFVFFLELFYFLELHATTNGQGVSERKFRINHTLQTFLTCLHKPLRPIIEAMHPVSFV